MFLIPLALAIGLSVPTLSVGYVLDDWIQHRFLREPSGPPAWDLFAFSPGNAEQFSPFITRGTYPWYTLPELKLHFFRPLSSLLTAADEWLWGAHAWACHLHSLLWYAACVAVATAFYRRLLPRYALFASALFAIDDSHALGTLWLSNRNALVSAVFGSAALLAHLKWREDNHRLSGWLAPALAAASLAGGELGIGMAAYIVAYELFGRHEAFAARVRSVLPLAFVFILYVIAYKAVGAGAFGSGTYIDPLKTPLSFLAAAPTRVLILFGSWASGIPTDFAQMRWTQPFFVGLGLVGVSIWGVLLAWLKPLSHSNALRWLIPGLIAATVPGLATYPAERLLFAASYGLCALVAVVASQAMRKHTRMSKLLLALMTGAFIIQPVATWIGSTLYWRHWGQRGERAAAAVQATEASRVVVLCSADFLPSTYGLDIRRELHLPIPTTWHPLSIAPLPHQLVRTGERTFTLETVGGRMLDSSFEQILRDEAHPMPLGFRAALEGLNVEVQEVLEGHPSRVQVTLEHSPDAYLFLAWDGAALVPVQMPAPGERLDLCNVTALAQGEAPGEPAR